MKKILVIAPYELQLAGILNRLYEAGFDSMGARSLSEAVRYWPGFVADKILVSNLLEENIADVQAALGTAVAVETLVKDIDGVVAQAQAL